MTPTNKLRFVEREEIIGERHPMLRTSRTVRILQQWWEDRNITLAVHIADKDGNPVPPPARGEWRDVPVEKEHG
jgi:hypothetical protein